MSEHQLITPRRNFLIRALGFTAAGATVSIPVLLADDPHKRAAIHMGELVKALQEIYPHVGLSGGMIRYAGWGNGAFVYPGQAGICRGSWGVFHDDVRPHRRRRQGVVSNGPPVHTRWVLFVNSNPLLFHCRGLRISHHDNHKSRR